jgi:hypothetical protein
MRSMTGRCGIEGFKGIVGGRLAVHGRAMLTVRSRGLEKESLLWRKAAPNWSLICIRKVGRLGEGLRRKVGLSLERRERRHVREHDG